MTQHKPLPRARRWHRRAPAARPREIARATTTSPTPPGKMRNFAGAPVVAVCLIAGQLAHAAGVKVEIRGVDEELRANVLAYLSFERYRKGGADLNADTVERLHNRAEREVQAALKPFGYYEPQVESTITDLGHNDWRVNISTHRASRCSSGTWTCGSTVPARPTRCFSGSSGICRCAKESG